MQHITNQNGLRLACDISGPETGAPLILLGTLGTDMTLWDAVLPLLPAGLRILRFDMRGHGQSDTPAPPYSMGTLVSDAETVIDAHGLRDAVCLGLSLGGMVAQGLAVKRLDLVRAVILSNTAARIATRQIWQTRIDTAKTKGLGAVVDDHMARWFGRRGNPKLIERCSETFLKTPLDGYIGACTAIAGADFITPTSGLRCPALGIAGAQDGATPPDMVRELIDLIPGSKLDLIKGAGHLPCLDQPESYATAITRFLTDIGHI